MNTLSLNQVCELLKITVQTGRNRISTGKPMPPSFRIGRRRLFVESEVINWIQEKHNSEKTIEIKYTRRGRPTKAESLKI
jgi:predicted DNA-binding transcriptional regulator AlpA